MRTLHIDFETRSAADLRKVGAHKYADDPTTDVWCLALAMDGEDVVLLPHENRMSPLAIGSITRYVEQADEIVAHNAAFELAIWNRLCVPRYGWSPLPLGKMRCTMAQALAMSLPGSLDGAAKAVDSPVEKDDAGHRLMLKLCRPRKRDPLTWWDDPAEIAHLYEYCRQDVRAERELDKRLLRLSPPEMETWRLDQKMNDRGFAVNVHAASVFAQVAELEKNRLKGKTAEASIGFVEKPSQVEAIRRFVTAHGIEADNLTAATIKDLLARDDLPGHVRDLLLSRQEFAKATSAKFKAAVTRACDDGRVRGALQYHGAGTGRWAGRGLQPQNLARPMLPQSEIDEVMGWLS